MYDMLDFIGQITERDIDVKTVMFCQRFKDIRIRGIV
jgi:hypothetical protein